MRPPRARSHQGGGCIQRSCRESASAARCGGQDGPLRRAAQGARCAVPVAAQARPSALVSAPCGRPSGGPRNSHRIARPGHAVFYDPQYWPHRPCRCRAAFQRRRRQALRDALRRWPMPAPFSASRSRRILARSAPQRTRKRGLRAFVAPASLGFLSSIDFAHIFQGVILQAASLRAGCTPQPCTLCRQTFPYLYRQDRARSPG